MRTSLPCSRACLTSLKAEYVASDVPRTRRREEFDIRSSLDVSPLPMTDEGVARTIDLDFRALEFLPGY
jgi:hypothetical protein